MIKNSVILLAFLLSLCLGFVFVTHVQAAYRDTIQSEGTLLYYWPMDEAVGATTSAALVGGIPINLTGATAGQSGQVDGTSVSFNGTSNFGVTSSTIDLTAYTKVVVEGLFYFNSFNNTDDIALESGTNYNSMGSFHFNPNASFPSGTMDSFLYGSATTNGASYARPSAAAWHLFDLVYDMNAGANEVALYIDGESQTYLSTPWINDNSGNHFGNLALYLMGRAGTALFTQGSVQHLAIYSDLSSGQVLAHAQAAGLVEFSPGTLTEVSHTKNTATLSWTDSVGGVVPTTAQLQRSPSGLGSWADISGATSSPFIDSSLDLSTSYDYRVAFTDATPTTVYSNTVTITTDAEDMVTYTILATDLWDNGYDNISAPRQSAFARFVFTTTAADIVVGGTTSIYANYPTWAQLGLRINGVEQSPLEFTANGSASFNVNLGVVGVSRTVEIISGLQSKPAGAVIGTFVDSITYPDSTSFSAQSPTVGDRILFYGDSISVGANASNPESQGYVPLIRNTYGFRAALEGWGYRSLYDDANTAGLRSAFVSQMASYTPSIVWLTIGTNDYGLNKWSAVNFGTAYAATLDDLHTALPSARIVCQTPIVRSNETANGSGNTLGDYRSQINSVCGARSWTTLVDGAAFLTTADLGDGVHPSTAGHTKYAQGINSILTVKPTLTTSAASSLTSTSAILNGIINTTGSTTPTTRGFNYGLTTNYEIATTTESGSFSTGSFTASISDLVQSTGYHFRSYATNFAGTSYGADQAFTTGPDVITNLTCQPSGQGGAVFLSWTIPEGIISEGYGYTGQYISGNSITWDGGNNSTFGTTWPTGTAGASAQQLVTGLNPNTQYSFILHSLGDSESESDDSNTATCYAPSSIGSGTADITPPTSEITSTSNKKISGRAKDTGDSSVQKVEISLDNGTNWTDTTIVSSDNTYVYFEYNYSNLAVGAYQVKIRAYDWIGNRETPGSATSLVVSTSTSTTTPVISTTTQTQIQQTLTNLRMQLLNLLLQLLQQLQAQLKVVTG